jgi:hypothetical protein
MTDTFNPLAIAGHNNPPDSPNELSAYEAIKQEIDDLFDEAKNWADGEPVDSQDIADAITALHDNLHDAGKRADEERKLEAKPHDDAKAEIQQRYNLLIGNTKTTGKGKVVLGKETLQALLTPWRNKLVAEKEAAAKAAREEADRIAAEAQAAIRASAGNLEEREKAEELLKEAKQVDRWAKREDRAATTGTGLRTVWHAALVDEGQALDWAYGKAPERFKDVVQQMANEAVRAGMRSVPGFRVYDERVAR